MGPFIIVLFCVFLTAIEIGRQSKYFATAFFVLFLGAYVGANLAPSTDAMGIMAVIILIGIGTSTCFKSFSKEFFDYFNRL